MYPDCRTPVEVMPNPVLMNMFDPAWAGERHARGNARPHALFVGGDFPRKGGPLLLDVWRQAGFAARADLTIVTDWNVPQPLPEGVRVVRHVKGQTAEWAAIWHAADLFVMPTHNEAFGLVYQEAAAAGLPAIGSRLNAVPEIIHDGETGLLVDPHDPRELSAALDRLIGSAELRLRIGRAARAKMELDADPELHRRKLLALIAQVSDRHG
jgi:glycosyltransferase involved in cell wall biosynthesis